MSARRYWWNWNEWFSDVHVAACIGDAARELARLADEHQADALVLGAPEHRLHHLVGSVPVWMARHAHCPVVIVP
jgi:nucleotide-binding universal stress UspA family protein